MCQPANKKQLVKGIYGVIPYMAPEILRGYNIQNQQIFTLFGIIMNEFLSEEIPLNNILHDEFL
ncbi:hypothetical protein RhiirB3_414663, partial [Rhizophagus irregularis]